MKARAGYWIVGLAGIAGLILSFIYCFQGLDWKGSFLGAILSMLLVIVGVGGIEKKDVDKKTLDEIRRRQERRGL